MHDWLAHDSGRVPLFTEEKVFFGLIAGIAVWLIAFIVVGVAVEDERIQGFTASCQARGLDYYHGYKADFCRDQHNGALYTVSLP